MPFNIIAAFNLVKALLSQAGNLLEGYQILCGKKKHGDTNEDESELTVRHTRLNDKYLALLEEHQKLIDENRTADRHKIAEMEKHIKDLESQLAQHRDDLQTRSADAIEDVFPDTPLYGQVLVTIQEACKHVPERYITSPHGKLVDGFIFLAMACKSTRHVFVLRARGTASVQDSVSFHTLPQEGYANANGFRWRIEWQLHRHHWDAAIVEGIHRFHVDPSQFKALPATGLAQLLPTLDIEATEVQ